WVFRALSPFAADNTKCYVTDVFVVELRRLSATPTLTTLYIDNVSTGLTCAGTDWITVQNSCDGGTTAYCNVLKNGVLWYQTSKAVSSTTINKYLKATMGASNTNSCYVDKARVSMGTTR
ncbi:MAG: hypothetical protein MUO35_06600, partial [Anaerolineales bacterium]|nr:hypothetical protein [Anaerolineales bacterium]